MNLGIGSNIDELITEFKTINPNIENDLAKLLKIAKENAINFSADIKFIQSNWYQNINDKFDIIVSNPPYIAFDENTQSLQQLSHVTVEKGDGKYMAIAAASILAKTSRDNYVLEMCEKYPVLCERYGLDTNMGYGTATHMAGIKEYGVTEEHRRSFAPVRNALGLPQKEPFVKKKKGWIGVE